MSEELTQEKSDTQEDFADAASEGQEGFIREFWDFLRFNKKWWITPILLVLVLMGALVMMGSGAAAPFIYTLF